MKRILFLILGISFVVLFIPSYAQEFMIQSTQTDGAVIQTHSIHGEHYDMTKGLKIELEPEIQEALKQPRPEFVPPIVSAGAPSTDTNCIVFGYQQVDGYEYHYRWHALTHIGYTFIDFDSTGNINLTSWDNRPTAFKSGGAAQLNGVKVVMVVRNKNFDDDTTLPIVMQNSTLRRTLINNIMAEVTTDSYCAGVSLDLEFSWNTTTRNGITQFIKDLYTALKSVNPPKELSVYTHAIYSSTYWDIPAIKDYIDYMLYSCYDWGSGLTAHAISDCDNFVPQVNNYLDAGLPADKCVLVISLYGRDWTGTNVYNGTGTSATSIGFSDGLYDTTLEPTYGGPYINNYRRGDEVAWYTYTSSTTHCVTWDDMESLEYKIRLTKSWQDSSGIHNGKRLRGVGFWSLYWLCEGTSYDPITKSVVSRTRTYGQPYQLCEEIFTPPGERNYLFEKFEAQNGLVDLDLRWRDPNESPDTIGDTDSDSARAIAAAPAGTGKPANSDKAMQVTFDFENASGNKLFFRHEILNDGSDTTVTDINSAKAYTDRNSKFRAYLYIPSVYSGRSVAMILMDNQRELEKSNPISLTTVGWQLMEWDLTDPTQIHAYNTNEPAFIDGDGILDSSTTGTKDIAFIGFLIEGGGAGSGSVYFDELSYLHTNPSGKNYVINEFRYANPAQEFIEIYGPAGPFPNGMQLRIFERTQGAVTASFNLTGYSIPDDGAGYGYFVIGDPGTPNVDYTSGFSTSVDNIPNDDPTGLQLYNVANGCVYDSVVYEAFGGLDDLIRKQTLGVTQNGYPWLGEIATGTNSLGSTYTMGRYPDGKDTYINGNDFSVMPATPGAPNGNSVPLGSNYDFSSAPFSLYQTYDTIHLTNPTSAGLPASPSGGNAYRCVDTAGGGVIGFIGDAALGQNSTGYTVTGEIYIPASTATTQAIAVGICGRQGSTFFTSDTYDDYSGYETGYWLIYENRNGVGLNDGRPDHPGIFEFVYATNDNMDTEKVVLLGSLSRASTGAPDGGWTTFALSINPASNQLIAKINNISIYTGAIPAGGPISGAFQIGFRENHAGNPTSSEGTWIDNVTISAISAAPSLRILPTTMSFTTQQGTSNPATKPLQIFNDGSPSFTWSASWNRSWLYISSTSGIVNAYAVQTVQIGVTLGSLTYGNYTGQVIITASGALYSPQTVTVIFVVTPPQASLRILPTSMSFTTSQGGSDPAPKTIQIFNDGSPSFTWSATTNATWLYINPTSGSVDAFGVQTAQVGVKVGALTQDIYNGQITITANGALNSPQYLPVTFVVTPAATEVNRFWWLFE
ncbi:MAG: glycosyl hydrolase family 18 protein [bacterium]|nr:glycosyl hydrolase family 18 protein [bacterium]